MDDGSSDDTFTVVREWMDENVRFLSRGVALRQKNRGITQTLNSLVALARGEFIAILASDDVLEPEGIELRVAALNGRPDWLGVFGDCAVIDSKGHVLAASALTELGRAHIPALLDDRRITGELTLRWSVPGPALLVRRIAFDEEEGVGMYDESMKVEDRDFYLRLLSRSALGFIPNVVARYRVHGKNSILVRRSEVERDVVVADWRNLHLFRGWNRCVLRLVALHGSASVLSKRHLSEGHRVRAVTFWLFRAALAVVRRVVYFSITHLRFPMK